MSTVPEKKWSDLSGLRIERSADSSGARRGLGFLGWVFVLLGMAGTGYGGYKAGRDQVLAETPLVELGLVQREGDQPAKGNLTASGYVISRTKAGLTFKTPGRIIELNHREGDKAKAGDVIARIDSAELQAQRMRAVAATETARAALLELKAGSRAQEIEGARFAVIRTRAALRDSSSNLGRIQGLFTKGGASRQQLDAARMSRDMLSAELASLEQTLDLRRAGPTPQAVSTLEARLAEADAQVKVIDRQLAETELRAPFDGVVIERHSEVGETLSMGGDSRQPSGILVVTLADLSHLEAEVDISENNLALVVNGGPAEVIADAFPEVRFKGKVRMILPRANRQKAIVPVKVTILDPGPQLRPDMSCKVSFLAKERPVAKGPPRVLVSRRAVVRRGDQSVVYTVQAGIARELVVTLGDVAGDQVEVKTGLTGGEEVVIVGVGALKDGSKVRVKGS